MAVPFTAAHNFAAITANPVSVPVTVATAAGDAIVVSLGSSAGTNPPTGIADSQGNSYILWQSFTTNPNIAVWVASGHGVKALTTSDTFTATYTLATGNGSLIAVSCPGTLAVDNSAILSGSGPNPSVSTTTAIAGDTALGFFVWASTGGTGSAPSFTQLDQEHATSSIFHTAGYQLEGAAGTVTPSYTIASAAWRAVVVVLQPAALANNAEGGTSGTTVTTGNSGGASVNAFDVVTIGTSSAVTFDNGHAAHGSLAYKMAVPVGVANISSVAWTTSLGTQTTVWFRLYLYFTSQPATFGVWRALQGASLCAGVVLVSDGTMQVRNAANGTVFTTASVIPINQWFRLEGFVTGSASTGQVELKFFSSLDATVPDETQTSLANLNLRGPPNTYQAGALTSVGSTFWIDDLGVSTVGYMGPAGIPGTAVLSGSGTLAAGPVLAAAATMSGSGTLTAGPVLAAMATMSGLGTLAGMPTVIVTAVVPGESVSTVAALAGSSSSVTSAGSSVSTVTTLN